MIANHFSCTIFALLMLPCIALSAITHLILTTTASENGVSVLQCWQLDAPFITSTKKGTAASMVTQLGNLANASYTIILAGSNGDVVEILIGAPFLDGGFPKALSYLKILLPEMSWLPLAERNNILLHAVCDTPQSMTIPSNFMVLETLLGHQFTCKSLLLEAVTHPSHLSIYNTPSYQRVEYLDDALLNYLVTTNIFSHEEPSKVALQPHHIHTLRTAASFLAFYCLSRTVSIPVAEIASPDHNEAPSLVPTARPLSLSKCLRHAPILALASVLSATRTRFAALGPIIDAALSHGLVYPWRAFAAFAPEKVFSEMIEAVLGAVYLDTAGDLRACDALLRRSGITDWVETTLQKEV